MAATRGRVIAIDGSQAVVRCEKFDLRVTHPPGAWKPGDHVDVDRAATVRSFAGGDYPGPGSEVMRMPRARLAQLARYLRAIQVRLQRQAHDPQKDQQKAAQVVPLWQAFLRKRDELRARSQPPGELDEFGWLIEELRVAVFAPELKTAVAVSPQRLQDIWARLSRL